MESNKDDAAKCFRIGKAALDAGDRHRALKFLSKARRLDPSLPIDDLLADAQRSSNPSPTAAPETTDPPASEPAAKAEASAASSSSSSAAAAASYTEEQIDVVRRIRKQKDYYQILGLERSCSVEDVRKAYRKLSLKVHPDKNSAPGADEAFKTVSRAFKCLSDEESRKKYDATGSDEPPRRRAPAARRQNGYYYYDDEFDADEIFRSFFGGMAPATTAQFGTFRYRTGGMGAAAGGGGHGGQGSGASTIRMLIQVLPVLLLILVNFLPSSEPAYSLSRSYPYEVKLQTARGVPYYIKSQSKFDEEYPYQSSGRIALEQRINREYLGILSQNCRLELQRKQWGFSYQTPYCDMLQKFETTA